MQTFTQLCPFRKGCAMQKIYSVIASSSKPLTTAVIAKKAKVNFGTTQRMLLAMRNEYHNAPLRRCGVSVTLDEHGYGLSHTKPQPKAVRPERGASKKRKAPKAKKSAKPKPESPSAAKPAAPTVSTIETSANK